MPYKADKAWRSSNVSWRNMLLFVSRTFNLCLSVYQQIEKFRGIHIVLKLKKAITTIEDEDEIFSPIGFQAVTEVISINDLFSIQHDPNILEIGRASCRERV